MSSTTKFSSRSSHRTGSRLGHKPLYEHGIPENDVDGASPGVTAFLGGISTPKHRQNGRGRARRTNNTPRSSTSSTQSKSTSRSTTAGRYHTTENDPSSSAKNNDHRRTTPSRSSDTPKNQKKTSSSALSPLSPTSLIRSVWGGSLSAKKQKQKCLAVNVSTQTDLWNKIPVFQVRLKQDVTRSLSDPTLKNPERGCIGKGELIILKCDQGNDADPVYICRLVGEDGNLKFQSMIPKSWDAHNHMHLKHGIENAIEWDAYDSSVDPVRLRAFTFSFDDGVDMFATLFHFFGGKNVSIVKEFLQGGRFWAEKETLPPHSVKKREDDMDVDSDYEEHRQQPLSEEEETKLHGNVNRETQAY